MTDNVVYLLLETAQADIVAVRFPDKETAYDWEEKHASDIAPRGLVKVVSRAEALRLS